MTWLSRHAAPSFSEIYNFSLEHEVTGAWLSMVTRISSSTCFHQPASASSVTALTTQRAPRPRPAKDIFLVALASESEAQELAETVERPCTILRGGPCIRRHKRHSSPMALLSSPNQRAPLETIFGIVLTSVGGTT